MVNQHVVIHVDAICPWCWLTALWLYEVERVRPVSVTTKVFSLAQVNHDHRDALQGAERALRVLVAARRQGGEQAIRAVYCELGEAHHERDETLGEPSMLRDAVAAAGLDAALADAAVADDSTHSELLAEHGAVVAQGAFGVPTLVVDGSDPYFGPIVARRISGEEAGRLWDVVAPVLTEPLAFELKRTRTERPDIARLRHQVSATS